MTDRYYILQERRGDRWVAVTIPIASREAAEAELKHLTPHLVRPRLVEVNSGARFKSVYVSGDKVRRARALIDA
jgi:hypothetical protein